MYKYIALYINGIISQLKPATDMLRGISSSGLIDWGRYVIQRGIQDGYFQAGDYTLRVETAISDIPPERISRLDYLNTRYNVVTLEEVTVHYD